MKFYTTIKCPHCNYTFEKRRGFKTNIGLPTIECQNCKAILKTNHKPWSKSNLFSKIVFIIYTIFSIFFSGMILGAIIPILAGLIFKVTDNIFFIMILLIDVPICLMIWFIMARATIRNIKKIERNYNNNHYEYIDVI